MLARESVRARHTMTTRATARGVVAGTLIVAFVAAAGLAAGAPGTQELVETATERATGGEMSSPVAPGFAFQGLEDSEATWMAVAVGAGVAGLAGAIMFLGRTRFVNADAVLENDVRKRIYGYVRENVGANLKQVTDALGLTTTNAIWHLRKLEDAGLVHSRRFNGFKVFYPAAGGVEARKVSLSMTALANGNARQVLEFVVANPGAHQREIARALDVNHGTVRWHLKKLRGAELLNELKRGKTSAYFVTDSGLDALERITTKGSPVATRAATSAGHS